MLFFPAEESISPIHSKELSAKKSVTKNRKLVSTSRSCSFPVFYDTMVTICLLARNGKCASHLHLLVLSHVVVPCASWWVPSDPSPEQLSPGWWMSQLALSTFLHQCMCEVWVSTPRQELRSWPSLPPRRTRMCHESCSSSCYFQPCSVVYALNL